MCTNMAFNNWIRADWYNKCMLITVRCFIFRIYSHRLSSMKFETSERNELDCMDCPACPKVLGCVIIRQCRWWIPAGSFGHLITITHFSKLFHTLRLQISRTEKLHSMRPISFIKFRKRIETSRIMVVEHNFYSIYPSSIIWNVRALYWAANCPFLGCSPIFYGISLFNNCKITWQSKWIVEKSLFPSTSYISSWNIGTNALAPISWCIALKRLVLEWVAT